ncbi:MAG TPA: DUF2959 family protein [Verrucomicrobiota bacterium]|nr:DUF2959 family protein [Verrucomicrobiota bacterium]HQL79984.1 DUF2959 family protein [Verrucomicrobiota bacterium]
MTTNSTLPPGARRARRRLSGLALAALGAALIGCASPQTARNEPTPREDFLESRHLVVLAMSRVDATLRALDEVAAQANARPRPAYEAFAKAVQRIEVDSIRVRQRTQAMRARGDAYFDHWQNYFASAPNQQVRRRAEEHKAELKQSFEAIQQGAQQARDAFRPFLTDLQKLRAVLESDPSLARIDAHKRLMLAAKDKGRQVQQGLDRILAEMNTITALLKPTGAPLNQ